MKKIAKVFLIIISLTFVITGCNSTKKDDATSNDKINNIVIEDQTVKNINFKDFLVIYKQNISTVYFDVENDNDTDANYKKVKCNLYDKDNNLVVTFEENLGTLKSKEIKTITTKFDVDLTTIEKVEYILQ